ncbi:VOC family protein [Roseibacterium sp. SDUM158016]|uniref:VOC family protein n=1 Tax=Roseicyclus sediminis TaxID=2980997 RepID=UPI0021CFF618|nr:VOC family protein [Roseibacterium sp. SDUM158016]MCU4653544.1 VOC family protein [Roseibacterium sp. SDUM158016]
MPSRITFLVPEYDEGLTFFVEGLGWTCVEDIDQGRKRWVVVAPPMPGTALILARPTSPAQVAAMGAQAGDRVAFFLDTDDFARDADRIIAAGGRFLEEPRDEAYGRVAQWRDPWGNKWDLIGPATQPRT